MTRTTYEHKKTYYSRNTGADAQANIRAQYGQDPRADKSKGGTDIIINGKGYQIKSTRATACHGLNPDNARAEYAAADGFIFIDINTERAYIMNFDEYVELVREFGEASIESPKNGGTKKIRFNREFKRQSEYLEARAE